LQIDDFNGGDVFPPLLPFETSTDLYAGAVGGVRKIAFDVQGSSDGTQLSVLNGVYTHDSGSSGTASVITWNGLSGSPMNVDFTNGGASDRIRLALEIADLDDRFPTLELLIATSGGGSGASQGKFEFTADVSGIYDVPLDESAWDVSEFGNNPLNFEEVLSLQLTVRPRDADFVKIDNIATVAGASGNQPPVAEAGGLSQASVGAPAVFVGSQSFDPDGTITSYVWDFGDGTSGTGADTTHIYSEPGTYNVILTVTDDGGLPGSDSTTAKIGAASTPPVADAGGPYSGTVGVNVNISGAGSTDADGNIVLYSWDYGDGNSDESTRPQAGNVYASAGTYTVTLTVLDNDGETDDDIAEVTISEGNKSPVADAGPPVIGTSGSPVSFDASGSSDSDGEIVRYDWNFGDGVDVQNAGPTPSHTYGAAGNYTPYVTVTDDGGKSNIDTTSAAIDAANLPPTADAGGSYSGVVGLEVIFDGSASEDAEGPITSYEWNFGDGTTGTGATVSHVYTNAGTFTAVLGVTDEGGLTGTDMAQVTVVAGNQPPVADPGGPYDGVANEPVSFDGSGSSDPEGEPLQYDWDFGDGKTGTAATPSHTYTAAGSYVVTLTVTDDQGVSDSETTGAQIDAANQRPVADANGPYSGMVNVAVSFDGSASSDADGTIVAWNWDFGDGNSGTGAMPSNSYAAAGNYTVTLTVTDDEGATSAEAFSTATIDAPNAPPVADANGPYVGKVDVAVTFDGSASDDPDGSVVRYDWDYGDGTVENDAGPTPSHTYAALGAYDVVLTVVDNDGDSAPASTRAIISDGVNLPPVADADGPYSGDAGELIVFDGSASSDADGTIDTYDWDYGDGTMAADAGSTPSHTYAAAGNYQVSLTVTDNEGKSDTATSTASVGAANVPPTAEAGGPYPGVVGVDIPFDGSASFDADGSIALASWDFGDGSNGTGLFAQHAYAAPGAYSVTLSVTDNDGDVDTDTARVLIGDGKIPPIARPGGPYSGVTGTPVTFDGSESVDLNGEITSYDWDFGDAVSGSGESTDHTYVAASLYTVTLQVTDDEGLFRSSDTTATIGVGSTPPTAEAGGPYRVRLDTPFTFDASGSADPDGDIVTYDWDFGDGTTKADAGPTPSHTYTSNSKYIVTLTVTDNSGETDTDKTIVDVGVGNLPPQADAGDVVSGEARRDITFDGTGSRDLDGDVTAYDWDFGDGNTGTGPNPTHRYAAEGEYYVTLTVTDDESAVSSDVTLAEVTPRSGGGGGGGSSSPALLLLLATLYAARRRFPGFT